MGIVQKFGELIRLVWSGVALLLLCNVSIALAEMKGDIPLLSFSGAKDGEVVIESGSEHLLRIRYETELDWSAFKATVNGEDVTHYFNPKPRRAEAISVPLVIGDNLFEFEVGRISNKRGESVTELEHYELMVHVVKPITDIRGKGNKIVAQPPP